MADHLSFLHTRIIQSNAESSQTTGHINYKTRILRQKLKNNKIIDKKLYSYLNNTDSLTPRFYEEPKNTKKKKKNDVRIQPVFSYSGLILYLKNGLY